MIEVSVVKSQIEGYRQQYGQIEQQIHHLDQQRALAANTLQQLAGAISALEQLVEQSKAPDTKPETDTNS